LPNCPLATACGHRPNRNGPPPPPWGLGPSAEGPGGEGGKGGGQYRLGVDIDGGWDTYKY